MGLNGLSNEGNMNPVRPTAIRADPTILFRTISLFLIFGSASHFLKPKGVNAAANALEKTLILYDATSGAIPSSPLMSFLDVPSNAAAPIFLDGVTVMDTTTAGMSTYAGWVSTGASLAEFPLLSRAEGFEVNFTVQVEHESHANNNRAGFSVIILDDNAMGIELGFWQNEIWAQSDNVSGGLFTHGEGVAFDTTSGLVAYQLAIQADTYTLSVDGSQILTGPVRDYSSFDGFPDPYETPNFLFLGDDTTSAQARVRLSLVFITGTETIAPTATGASIPTDSPTPLPTDSPVPQPTATPVPSPTPETSGVETCPQSGLLILMAAAVVIKRKRRGAVPPHDLDIN
jgi:hypothetical protein